MIRYGYLDMFDLSYYFRIEYVFGKISHNSFIFLFIQLLTNSKYGLNKAQENTQKIPQLVPIESI